MKGPMRTQTLKGLTNLTPLHWRADRSGFEAFNPAFDSLMGGPQLSAADMDAYRQFIETVQFPPNPNQKLDRTLPTSVAGGNPSAGLNTFLNEPYALDLTCNRCHVVNPGPGHQSIDYQCWFPERTAEHEGAAAPQPLQKDLLQRRAWRDISRRFRIYSRRSFFIGIPLSQVPMCSS